MKLNVSNANFPTDAEGRTYHVNTKPGQCANRIVTVGDAKRAQRIAAHLDNPETAFSHLSERHFLTITGTYKGVPVSIVAIGMGSPMVDFFIRETRAIVHGPMAIVRLGSCGAIDGKTKEGQVIVPDSAIAINRNYDYFTGYAQRGCGDGVLPYHISKIETADEELSRLMVKELAERVGADSVTVGLDINADSFYGSQGRTSDDFYDDNTTLMKAVRARYPNAASMEMEDHTLFHLSNCAKPLQGFDASVPSIRAAAAMMVFFDRTTNQSITADRVKELEHIAGIAVLEAVTKVDLKVPDNMLQAIAF